MEKSNHCRVAASVKNGQEEGHHIRRKARREECEAEVFVGGTLAR